MRIMAYEKIVFLPQVKAEKKYRRWVGSPFLPLMLMEKHAFASEKKSISQNLS